MRSMITDAAAAHSVAVAVQPPLLADVLSRALRAAAYTVVVVASEDLEPATCCDLAVVTGRVAVSADVVIELPDDGGGSGTARTPAGVEVVDVGDVASVVAVLRRMSTPKR